jgi:hypothetical protein
VHIKLPKISAKPDFKRSENSPYCTFKFNLTRPLLYSICDGLKLQIRGIHGEHSETEGGVYDISNKARLGLTEFEGLSFFSKQF